MKWQTKNHIGEVVTWYSEDVIKQLEQENKILHSSLSNIGTWRCEKCGYYTPFGYICFNCGHDNSTDEEG